MVIITRVFIAFTFGYVEFMKSYVQCILPVLTRECIFTDIENTGENCFLYENYE